MSLVILQYSFMFDPSEVWNKMSEFEADFAAYLRSKGLEAQTVTPIGASQKVLIIQKQKLPPPAPAPTVSLKENLKNLKDPNTYKYAKSYK